MMAARYSRHRPFTRNGASLIRSIWNGSKGIRDLSNDNMLMVHKDVGGRSSLAGSESFFLCRPSLVRRLHELGSSRVGQSSAAYQTSNNRIAKLLFSPSLGCRAALLSTQQTHQDGRKDITKQEEEDPFDTLTDRIPERPVSVAEGASYSLVIIAGLAVAAAAVYAVFKELILEPAEYKIFSKSLDRVKHDSQVTVRLGTPIKGYGQESRNRAARQRIPNRIWKDELGIEHVEINFYIRGPNGSGKVYSEMFKDKTDRKWRFTYLIVDVTSPTPVRLMLESYIPS